jgi:hypothetical protein
MPPLQQPFGKHWLLTPSSLLLLLESSQPLLELFVHFYAPLFVQIFVCRARFCLLYLPRVQSQSVLANAPAIPERFAYLVLAAGRVFSGVSRNVRQ